MNFGGNNEYNDGFSYENWGGYNLLVKLNQRNPEVQNYICDVIRFWVSEFDVDGIRLDAADVLDFDFMHALRRTAEEVKEDFWLMGEVIHGDYSRWVNGDTLHSVTNYALHKALYSGHNDHNYFEIAHTVKYLLNMGKLDLYNFVDNHDVERIYTKLSNKAHMAPVHILLYTLPGIPSIYYGSEFAIEGKKEKFSDDSLRPALKLEDYKNAVKENPCTALITALGKVRQQTPALSYGGYAELQLTNRQFAFARELDDIKVIVTVNNDDNDAQMTLSAGNTAQYIGALSGKKVSVENGQIHVTVPANGGEIWIPADMEGKLPEVELPKEAKKESKQETEKEVVIEEVNKETEVIEKPVNHVTDIAEKASETEDVKESVEESIPAASLTSELTLENSDASESETKAEQAEAVDSMAVIANKTPEEMTVEELQTAILEKMANNGPVTEDMKRTVAENIWHDSLVNWLKSFR